MRKQHLLDLEKYLIYRRKFKLSSLFSTWNKRTNKHNRTKRILEYNILNKRKKIMQIFFHELLRHSKLSLKYKIEKITQKTMALEDNLNKQMECMNLIDEEKCQYSQKFVVLNEEIEFQKREIEKRNLEIANYKKIIQNLEKEEGEWRKKEKELICEIQNRDHEYKNILYDFETNLNVKTKQNEILTNENNKLSKTLKELNQEFECKLIYFLFLFFYKKTFLLIIVKKSELMQEKKSLNDKTNYSAIASKETEQKLKNSIKIASEFKSIIEKNNFEVSFFYFTFSVLLH